MRVTHTLLAGFLIAGGLTMPPAFGAEVPCQPVARPDEPTLSRHDGYLNKDGVCVHRPSRVAPAVGIGVLSSAVAIPSGATAQCRDGSYSFSQHLTGTCSRHGGVARWF